MPLGLWNGNSAPELPSWYTEEWFISNMQKYYLIMKREKLEDNRVAFVGKLLSSEDDT